MTQQINELNKVPPKEPPAEVTDEERLASMQRLHDLAKQLYEKVMATSARIKNEAR